MLVTKLLMNLLMIIVYLLVRLRHKDETVVVYTTKLQGGIDFNVLPVKDIIYLTLS